MKQATNFPNEWVDENGNPRNEHVDDSTAPVAPRLYNTQIAAALLAANEAAEREGRENPEDGGSCNFDQCVLNTKQMGLKPTDIRQINAACGGLIGDKMESRWWKGCRYLNLTAWGMGNQRTRMAEAAHKSLKAAGVLAAMYYQMD
jgi:hypothetical protein